MKMMQAILDRAWSAHRRNCRRNNTRPGSRLDWEDGLTCGIRHRPSLLIG